MLINLLKLLSLFSIYIIYYKYYQTENIYIADKIINLIKNSENVFWKLSQWISSRIEFQSNLKNNYLINNLKQFYENCPNHNFQFTKNTLENHFHKPINEIFQSIQETPDASGSIGQIHIATINNKKVAIKIKHPNIDYNIQYLCFIIKYFIKIRYLLKKINFDISGIEDYLLKQTNFINEASNLKKLKTLFINNEYVTIPEVYEATNDFIIMEYIDGDNIEIFYNKCIKEEKKSDHWEIMIKFWLFIRESILLHNFLHADLHKGNWKINNNKIIIYDLGIVIDNPKDKETNYDIWRGFECRSPKILSKAIAQNLTNDINKEEFIEELTTYLTNKMDIYSIDFIGDIRNLLQFLNEKNVVLNFQTLTYLLAFNLASLNFKNFNFIDDNTRTYYEQHLDRFALLREKCQIYNNENMKKQLELDEEFFINENKEILRQINLKKENSALDDLSSDSE